MPEALAILVIVVVAVAAWIGAWVHARNPANYNVRHEIERLHYQAGWLQERLEVARRENWGGEMIANLEAELEATRRQWHQLADHR